MRAASALVLLLLAGLAAAQAPSDGPAAPAARWKAVTEKVLATGTLYPRSDPFMARKELARLSAAAEVSHRADYLDAFGWARKDGSLDPGYYSIVSEDWKRDAQGNWTIDRWFFEADLDGKVVDRMHVVIRQDARGIGHGDDQFDLFKDPAAPARIRSEYLSLLAAWARP